MKYVSQISLRFLSTVVWSTVLIAALTGFSADQVAPTGSLSDARKNHTATVLADGRVLIAGGENDVGQLASAELYDADSGTFASAGSLSNARVGHAATLLPNGSVLITGGRNASGALASAEIFDASSATPFRTVAATMGMPRSRHTATLMADGKVLIAGGDLSGTAEIFDPATESFSSPLIAMIEARAGQSATVLPENSVLLAGGGTRSVELFDVQTSAFLSWPSVLNEVRTGQSAITAVDSSVFYVGGEANGTLERFDLLSSGSSTSLSLGAPSSSASQLANGKVLVLGSALSSLFNPVNNSLLPIEGADLLKRSGQTVTELPADKHILVVGGVDASSAYVSSAALYSPAQIVTDKQDYYPDEPVIVYGSGWKPGEQVDLFVVDDLGWLYDSTVMADTEGLFTADPYFVVLMQHLGVTFDLTAVGAQSGLQATHTFTDSPRIASVTVEAQSTALAFGVGSTVSYNVTINRGTANSAFTAELEILGLPLGASSTNSTVTLAVGVSSATVPMSVTTSSTTPAGIHPFTVRALVRNNGGNIIESVEGTANLEVTGKTSITGSFTVQSKSYDGTATATIASRSLTGIGTDEVYLEDGIAAFADKYVGIGKIVTGSGFTLGGPDAEKYTLSSVADTAADITPLGITGSFTSATKVYDGNTSATVLTRSTLGDVGGVSLIGGDATFEDKDVGDGKIVTLVGASLSGDDAGNYVLDSVETTTASITALHITGEFTASNKVYDGNTSATVLTRSTLGDVGGVSLIGGDATFEDKDVGDGKIVTLVGASLSGDDAGNYVLDSVETTTASITALHITGEFTASNKVYDGNTSATVLTRSTLGDVGGVSLIGGDATFEDKDVGDGKIVTLVGASLSGDDAGNYVLDSVETTTASITALHITGEFTASNKVYDGNTSATVLTRSTLGDVGGVSLIGGDATFEDKDVGDGKIVTLVGASLSGDDAGNYVLDSVETTTASITALHITGEFTASNKVYDGNTSATVLTRSTLGDVGGVSLIGGDATFEDKDVGDGKIVTLVGASLSGDDAGNYVLDSVETTTANITALRITGEFTADDKVYDGNTSATIHTRSLVGHVLSDEVSLIDGTASFDNKYVGIDKTVTGVDFALEGSDASNYELTQVSTTTADITTGFGFIGFLSPIGGADETGGSFGDPLRTFKLGSTIPVKFKAIWLTGGNPLVTGSHKLTARKYSNATPVDNEVIAIATDAATSGNEFRLSSGEWHFNLSTKGLSAGTWLLTATLEDGSIHTAWVVLKK